VQVVCFMLLRSSRQRLQRCFRLHLNKKFSQEVMNLKNGGNPNFRNFKTPDLKVMGQNDIWVQPLWQGTKNTIRGKVLASPKFRPWWILWIHVCLWWVCAPKVLQLHTNQLVVWFVQVYVNNWLTCHSS
jgi:hypothetical protein